MKRYKDLRAMVLGGAAAGMLIGILTGGIGGTIYGLILGKVSIGLAGAVYGGFIAGGLGIGLGLWAAFHAGNDDKPKSNEVLRIDVQQVSTWDRVDQ